MLGLETKPAANVTVQCVWCELAGLFPSGDFLRNMPYKDSSGLSSRRQGIPLSAQGSPPSILNVAWLLEGQRHVTPPAPQQAGGTLTGSFCPQLHLRPVFTRRAHHGPCCPEGATATRRRPLGS